MKRSDIIYEYYTKRHENVYMTVFTAEKINDEPQIHTVFIYKDMTGTAHQILSTHNNIDATRHIDVRSINSIIREYSIKNILK